MSNILNRVNLDDSSSVQCVVRHGNQRMPGAKEMHGTGGRVGGPEGCGGTLIIGVDHGLVVVLR